MAGTFLKGFSCSHLFGVTFQVAVPFTEAKMTFRIPSDFWGHPNPHLANSTVRIAARRIGMQPVSSKRVSNSRDGKSGVGVASTRLSVHFVILSRKGQRVKLASSQHCTKGTAHKYRRAHLISHSQRAPPAGDTSHSTSLCITITQTSQPISTTSVCVQ